MAKRTAFIVCGSSGGHKTAFIEELTKKNPNSVVISIDQVKQELETQLGRKPKPPEIGEVLENKLEQLFLAAKMVILDAAHHKRSLRRGSLKLLQSYGFDSIHCYSVRPPEGSETEIDQALVKDPPSHEEGFLVVA